MKKIIIALLLLCSIQTFAQYQGKKMSGSYVQPLQIRHTRDVGVDSMYYLVADTVSGRPYWQLGRKITKFTGTTSSGTLKHVKTNSANNRLGIETSMNATKDTATVGFAYSTLSPYDFVDTLDNIPFYRNSTTTNSMMQREDIVYDCFIDAFQNGDRTLSLAANTDSIIRFNSLGNSHLWEYSTTTGIAKYVGSKDKILKVDASVTLRAESSNTFTYTFILERERSGVWTTFLTDYSQMQITHLHARCNLSRLIDFAPGDRLRVRVRTTSSINTTIRSGYINVWSISSNIIPF